MPCSSLRMAVAFAARFVTRLPICQLRSTPATAPTASAFWAAHSRCRSLSLTRPSTSRGASRGRSSALPIAGARRPGGSAPNAPRSSAADQSLDCHHQLRFAVCGPAPWMIPPGYGRRLISGHAARSPGSCCLQTDRGSRHSQRTRWGSCYRSRRKAAALEPPTSRNVAVPKSEEAMANKIPATSRRDVLKISALSSVTGLLGATRAVAQPKSTALTIDSQVHAYERDHPGRPWAAALRG